MKFGHPRIYNPFQSVELNALEKKSMSVLQALDDTVKRAVRLQWEQKIIFAQMRDCYLTRDEQVARLDALDEVGAPQ